jgi:serine protease Do
MIKQVLKFTSIIAITAFVTLLVHNSDSQAQKTPTTQAGLSQQGPLPTMPTIRMGDPLPVNAFIELAKAVNPAVVNIYTSTMPRGRGRNGMNDPFLEMLERFYGFQMNPGASPQQALGTGFIIRDDGLIVTNAHVIQGADVINVQLNENDKKKHEATVIGADERTDLALIKLTGVSKLPTLKLGTSKDVQVGEWVAAFGNPFGQGHTMTKGIISAKGRELSEINRFPLLQTDTPINPGNSGGPLVNLKGEVIGVNNAINAAAQGIGFAIPIDEVNSILPQLEKFGKVKRGYLGVGLAELDQTAAIQLGLKDTGGALIAGVEKRGAADRAGIKPYDVVKEFNGKKIESANDLINAVSDAAVGSTASVKIIRDGKEKTLEVSLAERSEKRPEARLDRREFRGSKAPHDLGFEISEANPRLKKEFEIADEYSDRPVIVHVEPSSAASKAGLRPGDVIVDVNRRDVGSTADIARQLKKGTNTLRIARGDGVMIVVL